MIINIIVIKRIWKNISELHSITLYDKYHINDIDTLNGIMTIIDGIINNVFSNYQIMELYNRENLYITDKMQVEMIATVFDKVYKSISDNIINRLLLVYNKDYIEDIIAQKVQQMVLNYTIEVNGNYKK